VAALQPINKTMEIHVFLKGNKDAVIYKGDRIDVLDFEMNGIKYKQIRYFRNGFSKSELVEQESIDKIVNKET
jgi:hypothetical protein